MLKNSRMDLENSLFSEKYLTANVDLTAPQMTESFFYKAKTVK